MCFSRRSTAVKTWRWVLILIALAELVNLTMVSNAGLRKVLSDILQPVAAATAAGLAIWAVRKLRREHNPAERSWRIIALAQCFFALGQTSFSFIETVLKRPAYPGLPDVFFCAFYGLMIIGLWRLPQEAISRREEWNNALDVAAMALVGALAAWQFNLRLLVESLATNPNPGTWVSAGYTIAGTLLLLMIFSRLVHRLLPGGNFMPLLYLILGSLCLITADMLLGYLTTYTSFSSGSPLDFGWLLFSTLSGFAALRLLTNDQALVDDGQTLLRIERFRNIWTLSITYLWIALVGVVLCWSASHPGVMPLSFLIGGAVASTVLAVTRQIRALTENQQLNQQLQQAASQLENKIQERTAELQRQSERLQESDAFRKRVFDSSRMPIVVMDAATCQFLNCNPAAAQIYHYSSCEEVIGKTPVDVSAKVQYDGTPSPEKMRFYIAQALAENTVVFEWRHERPNREIWDAEVCLISFRSGERQFLQFTLLDITAGRQAQSALREQAALLDASHDAIIAWDLNLGIKYLNPAAEMLTGRRLAEAKARPLSFVLRTRSEPILNAAIQEVTLRGKWTGDLELLTDGGKLRTVASRWLALANTQGGAASVLITCNDITEQKQLQAQYLRAQRLESVGTLASGIAHDLNNILSPILMGVDLLETVVEDADTLESIAMMKESAHRGSDTVRQLLTFARGADTQKGPVQPRHLLKEITRLVQQTFPKNIQIYSDTSGQPVTVLADPSQLHQVLMNLCVNARDAMPDGGVLFLHLENISLDNHTAKLHPKARPISYSVFRVTDSGAGIPPEVIERIFEPFYTTKPQGKGTGLGLSTVLGIVENHDGFVQVESSPGKGTTFQVFIPASDTGAEPTATNPLAMAPLGRGECVLIVDDEVAILRLIESVLRKSGYQTMRARNASEAIHLYERNHDRIKAVLTDVMMPFCDGRSLIIMLYEQDPKLPIIAMSGLTSAEFQQDLKKRGACVFLSKPFTAEQLLASLAQAQTAHILELR